MNASSRLRPARALLHPLWLTSLLLLILNDHLFKGAGVLHELVTGKLSDVVGLIVAPALLAILVRARSRRALLWSHLAVGAGFAAIQLSDSAAEAVEALTARLGVPWQIWSDPSDLLALPALWVSWRWLLPAMMQAPSVWGRARQLGQVLAGAVGLLACVGTSAVQEPMPMAPQPQVAPAKQVAAKATPKALDIAALNGTWRALRLRGSDHAWQHTYRFADGGYRASGYPAWEESGRVEVLAAEPTRLKVRFTERVFDGNKDAPRESWITLQGEGEHAQLLIDGDRYERRSTATVAVDVPGAKIVSAEQP